MDNKKLYDLIVDLIDMPDGATLIIGNEKSGSVELTLSEGSCSTSLKVDGRRMTYDAIYLISRVRKLLINLDREKFRRGK